MTAEARVEQGDNGRVLVGGELSFSSVPRFWRDLCASFPDGERVDIDLSRVQRADSAGLALLVECLRQAQAAGREVRFFNIPPQMLEMARVSGLDAVLPLAHD
ncbi:MAG TPA: anti-sigma factor antagonist [Gammaproteobacteria bacterium]|nr:anti-sigma factor antagonist [Gammaproteobacteria bacterium]